MEFEVGYLVNLTPECKDINDWLWDNYKGKIFEIRAISEEKISHRKKVKIYEIYNEETNYSHWVRDKLIKLDDKFVLTKLKDFIGEKEGL